MMQQYRKYVQAGSAVWWPLVCALVLWLGLYWETLLIAINTWYVSEIFSHGFFILPGVLYMVWREHHSLRYDQLRPNYWIALLLVPVMVLGVFGRIGGIQVFAQFSAFVFLSLATWLVVGNRIARQLWFPLMFLLFSIPVGEELVPTLQHLTAQLAVEMLSWTTLPIYHTGLYIEIPQGKFVVAEACSGIRFFIGSLVFGAIYSHLTYRSFARKCAFMALATVLPIVANAVRVFGIVLIGYYSDMEYATGADHLIYGWVFFAIVLILLVLIGERFKDGSTTPVRINNGAAFIQGLARMRKPLWGVAFCLLLGNVWTYSIDTKAAPIGKEIDVKVLSDLVTQSVAADWQPIFNGTTQLFRGQLSALSGGQKVDLLLAFYPEDREGSELISSQNIWFQKDYWSIESSLTRPVNIDGESVRVRVLTVQSAKGLYRSIAYVYALPDAYYSSAVRTKLTQTVGRVLGGSGEGAVIALSLRHRDANFEARADELVALLATHSPRLRAALPWAKSEF